jgi:outer membrane protein
VLKTIFLSLLGAGLLFPEVHPLTLRQVAEMALRQNPDLVLSRLDEQRAQAAVRVAKDPFSPKVFAGSGAAYTHGYPNSIEGAAPSIVQVRTDMALYNRPLSYQLAEVRENARGAAIASQSKADDVALRAATLFLDAQQLARSQESLANEAAALERVRAAMQLRVQEGRELPIENTRAELSLAQARQRSEALAGDLEYAENSLAVVLGFPAGDRVQPMDEERTPSELPATEEAATSAALENNKEIRRLESQIQARSLDLRSYKAERLPQVDLVAQYALFAKYAYQQFFQKFERNNGQIGVSIKIPLLVGTAARGYLTEAEIDVAKLRAQVNNLRNQIALDTRKTYLDVKRSETARDVAKLDLELAREQVSVLLAQMGEGRAPETAVDRARLTEQEKWIAFYDAQHSVERARLNLLHETGTIVAALR